MGAACVVRGHRVVGLVTMTGSPSGVVYVCAGVVVL